MKRELISEAEELGLKYIGERQTRRHLELVFENFEGKKCVMRMHAGNKDGLAASSFLNKMAVLKRFARGEYHGVHFTEMTTSG